MKDKLKSCPFCGGKARIKSDCGIYHVECSNEDNCLALPWIAEGTKEFAIKSWNTRQTINEEKLANIVFENYHGKTHGDCARNVAKALNQYLTEEEL